MNSNEVWSLITTLPEHNRYWNGSLGSIGAINVTGDFDEADNDWKSYWLCLRFHPEKRENQTSLKGFAGTLEKIINLLHYCILKSDLCGIPGDNYGSRQLWIWLQQGRRGFCFYSSLHKLTACGANYTINQLKIIISVF